MRHTLAIRVTAVAALAFATGCATLSATGDTKDYPIQLYAGAQRVARAGPARRNEPPVRDFYRDVYVFGFVANAVADTLVLHITLPLTL